MQRTPIARIPEARLDTRPAARPRTIRDISHHIFQVPDAFLQTVVNGIEDWSVVTTENAPPGTDLPAILAYAEEQKKGLADWWSNLEDRSCTRELKMAFIRCTYSLSGRCGIRRSTPVRLFRGRSRIASHWTGA